VSAGAGEPKVPPRRRVEHAGVVYMLDRDNGRRWYAVRAADREIVEIGGEHPTLRAARAALERALSKYCEHGRPPDQVCWACAAATAEARRATSGA